MSYEPEETALLLMRWVVQRELSRRAIREELRSCLSDISTRGDRWLRWKQFRPAGIRVLGEKRAKGE